MRVIYAPMDPCISGVLVAKQTAVTIVLREGIQLDPYLVADTVDRLLSQRPEAEEQQTG